MADEPKTPPTPDKPATPAVAAKPAAKPVAAASTTDAKLAVAHGNGGMLGSRHAASTIILGKD